jgi:hypothetical protein
MKKILIFASLIICTPFTTFTMENDGHQKRKDFHWHTMDDVNDNDTTTASSSTQQLIKDLLAQIYSDSNIN